MRTLLLSLAIALPLAGADDKPADGYVPMFNGKNLDGWHNVNCAPGTFFTKGEEIITTGTPTGFLATNRQYENFELEMDWMHVEKEKMANSGLFVWGDPLPAVGQPYTRGIEVQVLINYKPKDGWATSHGDIFSIHGAKCTPDRPHFKGIERCLPSEERVKGGGEWNHYKVIANDGVIKLHVNGKEVSGVSKSNPRKGYLALESEGVECHFKNLKIKELPSTNPKPEEIAKVWEGHTSLFTGLTLDGWKTDKDSWKVAGGAIKCVGKEPLTLEKKAQHGELIYDWRFTAKSDERQKVSVQFGLPSIDVTSDNQVFFGWFDPAAGGRTGVVKDVAISPTGWNRTIISNDGKTLTVTVNGKEVVNAKLDKPLPEGKIAFQPQAGLEIMNVFLREPKEK